MYRLIRFKATNLCGFLSGLNKKTVDIDLTPVYDKDVIAVLGENGSGKSTFLSMIHPVHTPSDKRTKFIAEGKEGSIIREYINNDGSRIVTKAIYTPKKDGHTAKLYFKVVSQDGEETELNPSGNVSSYNELLYTYMGVNKDYVAFASYNDLVRGIVDMTDTERKLNVASLIPNTRRFETAYNIINDKYRDLRTTIRNISQKIAQLSDKDELEARVVRLADAVAASRNERDRALKKASKLEGQLKAMTGGKSADELMKQNQKQYDKVLEVYSGMMTDVRELKDLVYDLGNFDSKDLKELITFANTLCEKIPDLEIKYAKTVAEDEQYRASSASYQKQINELENDLTELQASLFSLRTQDVDELKQIRSELQSRIKRLEYYDPDNDNYDDMSFERANTLANQLDLVFRSAQGLSDRYGEVFSDYFNSGELTATLLDNAQAYYIQEAELKDRLEKISTEIAEKEQYRKLQYILEKRPANCVDDTCPFIANALQWNSVKPELDRLHELYNKTQADYKDAVTKSANAKLVEAFNAEKEAFEELIKQFAPDVDKYTLGKYPLMNTVRQLSKGDPELYGRTLDELRRVAAILSEKSLYLDIVNVQLPKINSTIELAENSQISRAMIERQIQQKSDKLSAIRDECIYSEMSLGIIADVQKRTANKLSKLRRLREVARSAEDHSREFSSKEKEYKDLADVVEKISDIKAEIEDYKEVIRKCDKEIAEYEPALDKTRYMLRQLGVLKLEEAERTHKFMVVDIMRSIVMPGKGLWKEAIDIYMSEINTIANQVLQNTFGGALLLEPFELTDKSFIMPYTYNGSTGPDISFASSSQRATVATAISMAIISKMVDKYSTITLDEFDATLSPSNKEVITEVLVNSMKILGIGTAYVITHNPENYEKAAVNTGYILFPGGKISGKKDKDYVEVK